MKQWVAPWTALIVATCAHEAAASPGATPTIPDAVEMARIQPYAAADGSVVAISPNGRKAAAVVWRGDIARNLNVYSLLVFDIPEAGKGRLPETLLSRDLPGDPSDQSATAFSQLRFLGDNRSLLFLGREGFQPEQVYAVDTISRAIKQLTNDRAPIRSFDVDRNGALKVFSRAVAPDSAARRGRIESDGVLLSDRTIFPLQLPFRSAMAPLMATDRQIREYLLPSNAGPRVIFDSRQSRPAVGPVTFSNPLTLEDDETLRSISTLLANEQGTKALLFPYAVANRSVHAERYAYYNTPSGSYTRAQAAPYGLIDLADGHIETLIDAPHPPFGNPLWVPGGRSVIINTLLPDAPAASPQWVEVQIATRRWSAIPVPPGWSPQSWIGADGALLLKEGNRFAVIHRVAEGRWRGFAELGSSEDFNPNWPIASNGEVVIGVVTAATTPPELAVHDLHTGRAVTISNLNPTLRTRRYGAAERFRWQTDHEKDAFGYLVKPVEYRPSVRYPLVVLLDDGPMPRTGEPYLLDAEPQMSGHPIQMLAAQGMMVLYVKEPRGLFEAPEGSGARMLEHVEGAIAALDGKGLIDCSRIGISGFSVAAYHVNYLVIHSKRRFAAASMIDGGAEEWNDRGRPFTDAELQKIRTPILLEAYGPTTLAPYTAMVDRLSAMGKPTEVLYFATATHSMTQPRHRVRSLGTELDWFRFWLQDQEDAGSEKRDQYVHWRELRAMR